MTNTLTDTQRVILSTAAERDDHRIWPFSSSLKANATALSMCVKSLIQRGLVAQDPDYRGHPEQDAGFKPFVVTSIGLAAIGIEPEVTPAQKTAETPTVQSSVALAAHPRQGSKLAALLEYLCQPDGATLAELVEVTGWQSHSVRGAISGTIKRKMGRVVETKVVPDRGRIYRVIEGAGQ